MPLNFGVFTALFPVTYLWQAEIYMHGSGVHAKEHFLKHRCATTPHRWRLRLCLSLTRTVLISDGTIESCSRVTHESNPWPG